MSTSAPTDRQQYWLTQLEACKQQKMSMMAYAKQHGIKPYAFYDAKKNLVKAGLLPASIKSEKTSSFKKVRLSVAQPVVCVITFPNGIRLDWPAGAEPVHLAATCQAIKNA